MSISWLKEVTEVIFIKYLWEENSLFLYKIVNFFTKLRRKLLEIVWTALWCCDLVIWCFTVDILVSLNYVMTVFGANLFRLFVIENFKVSAICKKLWRVKLLYQYLCCSMLRNSNVYILSKWSIDWSKNEYHI